MPTISVFYGITIMMYLRDKEHNPPHIHAFYGNMAAVFSINDGSKLHGKFPITASKLVKLFIEKYQQELLLMWETGVFKQLKGLD